MLVSESKAVPTPRSDALTPSWKQAIGSAEPFLHEVNRRLADQVLAFDPEIARYARYALTGQGKQLRPALVALSAGATGEVSPAHVEVAVIIEMVHLATLVHDDIMDEARLRRGRPTLASNWGNEIAVLLGDCLFAHSLKLAAGFPTTEVCRSVSAATNTVCAGEILQTQARHNTDLSREDYFKMLRMKTGELFALSCDLGAYLNGAGGEVRSALRQYGLAMGTAYQIFDDCIDLFGSEASTGKSLGTDLAKGKLTLPILILLEKAKRAERNQVLSWLGEWQPGNYDELRRHLDEAQVLEDSRKVVGEYLDLARRMLESLPASESRSNLGALAGYLELRIAALGMSPSD